MARLLLLLKCNPRSDWKLTETPWLKKTNPLAAEK